MHLPEDKIQQHKLPSISFWLDNPQIADPSHGLPGLSLAYLALSAPGIGAQLMPRPMRDHMTAQRGQTQRWAHVGNLLKDPVSAFRYCVSIWRDRRRFPVRPGGIDRHAGARLGLSFSAEERPLLQNRIELTEETDRFSVPRIAIFRSPDPEDVDGVIRANHLMVQRIQAAGFAEATMLSDDSTLHDMIVETSGDGFHQIGTARMGANTRESVIDQDCRVHGTKNLYIAGSAVFPRSGQANPTFTIICLAMRLAKYLGKSA